VLQHILRSARKTANFNAISPANTVLAALRRGRLRLRIFARLLFRPRLRRWLLAGNFEVLRVRANNDERKY
jgi:hypothetical protein